MNYAAGALKVYMHGVHYKPVRHSEARYGGAAGVPAPPLASSFCVIARVFRLRLLGLRRPPLPGLECAPLVRELDKREARDVA